MKNKPWTISTLKEKLIFYKRLLAKTKDPQEQRKLVETIHSYERFIREFTTPCKAISYQQICKNDQKEKNDLNEILPILLKASNTITSSNVRFPNTLFSINTSKETILKETKSFYSIIGGIYKDKYDEYYDTNAIYINFISNYDNFLCGRTLRPNGIAECFINISLLNNPYDIATSIHEHAHAISSSICEDHIEHPILGEVESIFFELVFLDMLTKYDYSPDQINNLKNVTIGAHTRTLCSVEAKNITTLSGIKDPNKAKKVIQELYPFDDEETSSIISSPLSEFTRYGLSYLIATELFLIYKRSEAKALSILEEIIRIDSEEEGIILKVLQELSINPGNNFQRFNRSIVKTK